MMCTFSPLRSDMSINRHCSLFSNLLVAWIKEKKRFRSHFGDDFNFT